MLFPGFLTRKNQFALLVNLASMLAPDSMSNPLSYAFGLQQIPVQGDFGIDLVNILPTRTLATGKR